MTTTMQHQQQAPTHELTPAPVNPLRLRLDLTGRAAVLALTALFGTALFPLWVTAVALAPLTVLAPLVIPTTWLVRRYADVHRTTSGRVLGEPVVDPYRPAGGGVLGRVLTIVRDPASWRDAAWLIVHCVVGFVTALLTVTLMLASVFYLIFPLLWAVTPDGVFRTELGVTTIDSLTKSFAMVPLALVWFGLWWGLTKPLATLSAAVDRALLRPVGRSRTHS